MRAALFVLHPGSETLTEVFEGPGALEDAQEAARFAVEFAPEALVAVAFDREAARDLRGGLLAALGL